MGEEVRLSTDHSVYRCPSCEHFWLFDGWSEDNDLCKMCLEEHETGIEAGNGNSI